MLLNFFLIIFILSNKSLDLTLSQTTFLDFSKLEEFADANFKFYEDGGKFSKWVENTVEKGEITCYEQYFLIG